LKLGAAGGLKLGAAGGLKLGTGGGVRPLGIAGALKLGSGGGLKLGIAGGVKPPGTEALGAAVLEAAGCVSLDGAGTASPVEAGVAGSALATGPVLVGAGSEGEPPASCEFATGWLVAAGCAALLEATGGFLAVVFAAITGFDPVLLALGSPGGD